MQSWFENTAFATSLAIGLPDCSEGKTHPGAPSYSTSYLCSSQHNLWGPERRFCFSLQKHTFYNSCSFLKNCVLNILWQALCCPWARSEQRPIWSLRSCSLASAMKVRSGGWGYIGCSGRMQQDCLFIPGVRGLEDVRVPVHLNSRVCPHFLL